MAMMLDADEQVWLKEFTKALKEQYAEVVEDLVVFDANDSPLQLPEDTINVMVRVKDNDKRRQLEKDIGRLGHRLAVLSDAMPFIVVYTHSEWKMREISGSLPFRNGGQSQWSIHQ